MAVNGINLNRFDPLTRILLQYWDSAPLYSLSGSPMTIRPSDSSLSSASSFLLSATAFSPAYAVFHPDGLQTTPYDRGQVVSSGADGQLTLQPQSQVSAFSRPLSLSFGEISQGLAVSFDNRVAASAPSLSASQLARTQYFAITDAHYDALIQGPDFILPNVGPFGLRVLTDGLGGIDGLETVITTQSLLNNAYFSVEGPLASAAAGVFSPAVSPTSLLPLEADGETLPPLLPSAAGSINAALAGQTVSTSPLTRLTPASRRPADEGAAGLPTDRALMPTPEAIARLQASTPDASSALAHEFPLTERFLEDVGVLKQAAPLNTPAYTRAHPVVDMSAFLPMIPTLPGPARTRAERGDLGMVLDQAFQLGAQLGLSVTGSKAREGQTPFETGTGGNAMQQSPRRHKRFQAMA